MSEKRCFKCLRNTAYYNLLLLCVNMLESLKTGLKTMRICTFCETKKPDSEFPKDSRLKSGLAARCKSCSVKASTQSRNGTYDADSIKILTDEQVNEKFGWMKSDTLAKKYHKDETWVANGLEACRRCGLEPDYFIERHLEGNKTIPKNELIDEAFRDVLKEQQGYGSYTKL